MRTTTQRKRRYFGVYTVAGRCSPVPKCRAMNVLPPPSVVSKGKPPDSRVSVKKGKKIPPLSVTQKILT